MGAPGNSDPTRDEDGADSGGRLLTEDIAGAPSNAEPHSPVHRHAHVHPHVERTRMPLWIAVVLAIVFGAGTALQSRINGQLAAELDDPYTAAAISFGTGLVILAVALAVWRPGREGVGRVLAGLRAGRLAWWMVLGGLAGAWFVVTQGLSAGVLGVAMFTVAIVAGQTIGGIVFDLVGLGPGGRRPLTPMRVLGALLALVAIGWAVSAQLAHDVPLLVMLFPFVAGLGVGWQQAVNGRVKAEAGSALTAAFGNFLVGTVALVVVMLGHAAIAGWPERLPTEPWLYLGGAIGCIFIAGQALVVRVIGVLLLALCGVAGQLAGALALDLLLPTGRPVDGATIGGTVLAVVAVAVASIRWSRHRHRAVEPDADGGDAAVTRSS